MKRIALFGASGQTGQRFLEKALEANYELVALVRNPDKIKQVHSNLKLIKGDVLNESDVAEVVKQCDIVVSLFGHVKDSPQWLQTQGTNNIVKAMEKYQVPRIVSLSGGGLPFPEKDQPKLADKIIRTIMKIAVPKILNDAIEHAEVLRKSNVKWTIVRGPRLSNSPPKGHYRVTWVGVNSGTQISRSDLADFIVSLLENEQYNYQMPFVSY